MIDPVYSILTATTNLFEDPAANCYRVGLPVNANIAADTIGRQANNGNGARIALVHEHSNGSIQRFTYAQLDNLATKFAVSLANLGVTRGDPVAVHTAQRPETAIAHMAIYKLGAVVLTLSHLAGPEATTHILNDSKAAFIITHSDYWAPLREVARNLEHLQHRIVCGSPAAQEIAFDDLLSVCSDHFEPVITATEDPAVLMYTSGATGKPKGVLLAHRSAHCYRPTLNLVYNLLLNKPGSIFWTPSDWAWSGGLYDLCFPAWQHGHTVISTNRRFSADWAFDFMARHRVTHSFMTATALKRLAEVRYPRNHWDLAMQVVCTSGESLPSNILRWCEDEFGIVCNELYGLTEFTDMIGCCKHLFPTKPGSMGRAFPGRHVAIIDDEGVEQPDGTTGEIASLLADDPTLILGYWGDLGVPASLKDGKWLRTGDYAVRDQEGYFWFKCRKDDLIKSAGYRIGPNEVEDSLVSHPDVAEAAVVGKPDPERGTIVMAYIRVANGVPQNDETRERLQQYVKRDLAAYQYPRIIEFIDTFPMTSTGKIKRNALREMAAREPGQPIASEAQGQL